MIITITLHVLEKKNMITITFDYFENCIYLQIITITDYDYPRSVRQAQKKFDVARPIHVSYSRTKFGSIWYNGSGVDSIMDKRTDGGNYNIPFTFLKTCEDKI